MSGHVGDVSLPVFAWLVSWELVQGLVYLEGSLWAPCGLTLAHIWQEERACKIGASKMGEIKEGL